MVLINYSHPVTPEQLLQIERLAGRPVVEVLDVTAQFDDLSSYTAQISALMERTPLTSIQWQTESILVILPALNFIAALLVAELHGRTGYFPTIVRLRPAAESIPRRYEVAELIDLQAIRELARRQR